MPCQNAAVVFRAGVQLHVTRQLGETTIKWGSGGQHKCLYFFEVASYWPFSMGVTTTKCFIETLREGHCISQHTLSFQMSTPAPCHLSLLSPHCVRSFPSLNIKHQSEPSCTFESGMKRSGGSFWGRFAYQFFFNLLLLLCSVRFVLLLNYITSCLWFQLIVCIHTVGEQNQGSLEPRPVDQSLEEFSQSSALCQQ